MWDQLPTEIRATAEHILTPRQLEALKLSINGRSTRRIALELGISETSARDRLARALQKLALHLKEQNAA